MSRKRFGDVTAVSLEAGVVTAALLCFRPRGLDEEMLCPSNDLEYPVNIRSSLSFYESHDGPFRCHGRPPHMPGGREPLGRRAPPALASRDRQPEGCRP